MLTDTAIKALKSQKKLYKVSDRDGMYVVVQPSGAIVFRYDYRLNGRRETLTLGRYGPDGLSLARAREKLIDAKRAISEGRSPAQEKQHDKRRLKEAKRFGEFGEKWFQESRMAESTRAMRRSIYERDILPTFRNRLLTEITPDDLRMMCGKVKDRGAPATAVHVRDIVKLIFAFGLTFELPVLLTLLAKVGIISSSGLRRFRRYAYVGMFVIAAILAPPDVITQTGLAVPLIALYEISIFAAKMVEPKPVEV